MSGKNSFLFEDEIRSFHDSMHLFPTNSRTFLHNKHMLKSLNTLIVRSIAKYNRKYFTLSSEDDQLDPIILLCSCQKVMLISNLWVLVGLANGSLKNIISIFYKESTTPPQLPAFLVVAFRKYIRTPWDETNPIQLHVQQIKRNGHT